MGVPLKLILINRGLQVFENIFFLLEERLKDGVDDLAVSV